MIYLTSDLHFRHQKDFLFAPRGFDNVWDMNKAIIKNWNSIIKPEDEVYVLGDLVLGNTSDGLECVRQLVGKIHIVRGNHDTDTRWELYKDLYNVVEMENSIPLKYAGYHLWLSHFPTLTSNFDYDKPLKARLINLCGHTHTQDKFFDWDQYHSPIYHVELDAHMNFPISLDQIIDEIEEKNRSSN